MRWHTSVTAMLLALTVTTSASASFAASIRDCPDCPELVVVPAGRFVMGSPETEPVVVAPENLGQDKAIAWEQPQHPVNVAKPFALGRFEITRAQFARFVAASGYDAARDCAGLNDGGDYVPTPESSWKSPGYPQDDQHPVSCINFADASAYVAWLSKVTGKVYRLPSEAEWEYAARAGATTRHWWGASIDDACKNANVSDRTGHAAVPSWNPAACTDGYAYSAPVGSFAANPFGLHDMLGNVWEWTADCWSPSYAGAPTDGSARTDGECATRHARRGGSFDHYRWIARVSTRLGQQNHYRKANTGFRVARDE